jgi:pimeloyl-ACP methyl ester carboxylesterase
MSSSLPLVAGVTHEYVDAGGLRTHVALAGDPAAPPVLLLHGWPQHWWTWREVVPLLADAYRLVMPDLRGQGWTDAPDGDYGKEQLTTDVLATLDALGLGQVTWVGHDWGGWVGFLAGLRAPDRLSGLVAVSVTHPWQARADARVLDAWRMGYQAVVATPYVGERLVRTPAAVAQVLQAGHRDVSPYTDRLCDVRRARASVQLYRTFLTREVPALLAGRYADERLRVPTLLLVGERDPVITPRLVAGYESHTDDMTVEVIRGAGHFLPESHPAEVARAVRRLAGS